MNPQFVFRACHKCGCLNEAEGEVLRCQACGKGFLRLQFMNHVQKELHNAKTGQANYRAEMEKSVLTMLQSPIRGLVVYW